MAAIDLTTVDLLRQWMPAPAALQAPTQAQVQDAILQSAITSASLDFLRRTGRAPQNGAVPAQSPFVQAVQYSETYDGNGNDRQFLRQWPIVSVQSLMVNGVAVQQSSGWPSPGYQIDGSAKSIVLIGGSQTVPFGRACGKPCFPRGRQNVSVTYTAGFAAQVATELDTVPASPGPYIIEPQQPWLADSGVKYFSNGASLSPVQIAPAQGQYYLNNGAYTFNAADAGQQLLISYQILGSGTPPDVELAVRRMVFLTYQRRSWEGLRSLSKPDSGQTTYSSWEIDPSVKEVIDNYSRRAIV